VDSRSSGRRGDRRGRPHRRDRRRQDLHPPVEEAVRIRTGSGGPDHPPPRRRALGPLTGGVPAAPWPPVPCRQGLPGSGLNCEAPLLDSSSMTYIVTETCVDLKDKPASRSARGLHPRDRRRRMVFIDPDECIDCAHASTRARRRDLRRGGRPDGSDRLLDLNKLYFKDKAGARAKLDEIKLAPSVRPSSACIARPEALPSGGRGDPDVCAINANLRYQFVRLAQVPNPPLVLRVHGGSVLNSLGSLIAIAELGRWPCRRQRLQGKWMADETKQQARHPKDVIKRPRGGVKFVDVRSPTCPARAALQHPGERADETSSRTASASTAPRSAVPEDLRERHAPLSGPGRCFIDRAWKSRPWPSSATSRTR